MKPTSALQPSKGNGYESLYSFGRLQPEYQGGHPLASLIVLNGDLYGTTFDGGVDSLGSVFKVSPSGEVTDIFSFRYTDPVDPLVQGGQMPVGGLVAMNGLLYGTTQYGGANGQGTVFEVSLSGAERVVHSFAACAECPMDQRRGARPPQGTETDGSEPVAGLVALNGKLYGTTLYGGGAPVGICYRERLGCGTVFEVSASGLERVLYSFRGAADGGSPYSALTVLDGRLYGTTFYGGSNNQGTVFQVDPSGRFRVIHSFDATDGSLPVAALTAANGVLYGTTLYGGKGYGNVFKITASGNESVVHTFDGLLDGRYPYGNVIFLNGSLYGTTYRGGARRKGSVFKMSTSGAERVLYSFEAIPDGLEPYAGLTALNGQLYGTTRYGGVNGAGTVFKLSP